MTGVNAKDLIWPIAAMFIALVAGVVVLAIFLPTSRDVTTIVTPLVAMFSTLALMIGGWVTLRRIDTKVDQVQSDTQELVNGLADAKVRAGVADVLRPELIDPEVQPQLAEDRRRRDAVDPG